MREAWATRPSLWRPGRGTKVLVIVISAVFALIFIGRPNEYDWMEAILMASVALILPILQFRQFWSQLRFWIVVVCSTAAQVPLVVWARILADQYRPVSLLAFGIGDIIFVTIFITSTCSTRKHTA